MWWWVACTRMRRSIWKGGGSGVCREQLRCFSHKNAAHSPARLAFSLFRSDIR